VRYKVSQGASKFVVSFFPSFLAIQKSQSQPPHGCSSTMLTPNITTTKYVLHSLCFSIGSEAHSFPASRAPCYLSLDILATLTDLKPTERRFNFQCLWRSRNYSSYVFLWATLSRHHFSVFLSRYPTPRLSFSSRTCLGVVDFCSLGRLSCRGYFNFWTWILFFHPCLRILYQLAVSCLISCITGNGAYG
jgi:hypothetical protein